MHLSGADDGGSGVPEIRKFVRETLVFEFKIFPCQENAVPRAINSSCLGFVDDVILDWIENEKPDENFPNETCGFMEKE